MFLVRVLHGAALVGEVDYARWRGCEFGARNGQGDTADRIAGRDGLECVREVIKSEGNEQGGEGT